MHGQSGRTGLIKDFSITLILWIYYIVGYLLFFSPFYLYVLCFSNRREESFQKLNNLLHRCFFALVRCLIPRVTWRISQEVRDIRSSIIVANHVSFLDPILFVSLFDKQKTIVKGNYFNLPVFGGILRTSGYITSLAEAGPTEDMLNQIKSMGTYLTGGGNIFVFPEGTRSRNGHIGPFDKGAFRIARLCRAPIQVVVIRNTDKLYSPDHFLFNTHENHVIEVLLAGSFQPEYDSGSFSLSGLMAEVRTLMESKVKQ
ncbi:MAG: lysophospholipid acyltransferase family protein [Syntrophales bacterium]|nr:lysophospholipid acyltransferase family protein [Syntrophales bacterium]